jgi:hypothetical protein
MLGILLDRAAIPFNLEPAVDDVLGTASIYAERLIGRFLPILWTDFNHVIASAIHPNQEHQARLSVALVAVEALGFESSYCLSKKRRTLARSLGY